MLASMRTPALLGLRSALPARQLSSVARSSARVLPSVRRSLYSTEAAGASSSGSQGSTPPPPPPKGGSSTGLWIAIAVAAAAGGYYLTSSSGATSFVKKPLDYQTVYKAIADSLEEGAEEYDDGSFGPVLIRLAWHASGTYDKNTNTGGSNGATMRFAPESNHGANAGLIHARQKLEPIKAKFPDLSYGDLWTLAGVVAVQEMGGPKIPWRPGRQDFTAESCPPDGRLPDGDKGADHVRQIFYKMGFNDQEIVALIGAHALGRCHKDRSGFDGPWTFSPTTFTNDFYKLLFDEKWTMRKWNGPPQFEDKKTKSLMMLMTDMALVQDKAFKVFSKKYADDQDLFFADFSKAFGKLLELGVPEQNFGDKKPVLLKTVDEMKE